MKTLHDSNPLAARQSDFVAVIEQGDAITPNQIILQNALAFSGPVICMVDEGFWLRADWDCPVPAGSVVRFIETPQGDLFGKILGVIAVIAIAVYAPYALGIAGTFIGSMLSAGIMIAGSLLLGMLFGANSSSGDVGTPDTVYTLSQNNRVRPGEPFAERFGRRPFYPDVAMSYTRFEDNEQYLYCLLIVGIGYFDSIVPTIGKTPLGDYTGVTYATVLPGSFPAICTNVVWTSSEVSGQELDMEWVSYVVNPRGTEAYYLEYDIVFSGGLIGYNDEGDRYTVSADLQPRCRTVDAYGNATSEWTLLSVERFSAASKDPLRRTIKITVPLGPGRYEFGLKRVKEASESGQVSDRCSLAGLRAIGGAHPVVDGVTMWECKIMATKQMNSDSGSKIQLEATRMLYPVTATGFGSSRIATRSIVDACAYMVTGDNGGRFDDGILAWDVLAELRDDLATAGYLFDYGFTSRVSVMDACSTAAACGSAVAYTPGGLFCLAANTQQVAYGVAFTDDDYDPDSLKITTTFRTPDSYTCVRVKYYDPNSGQEETVDCYEVGGGTLNPKEVNLEGCTSRQAAWEIGLLLYRDMMQSTVNVEFTTGLKGNLPSLFSWIPVASTVANWNQTGVLAAVESGGVIWTSEPLDYGEEEEGWILLALPNGSTAGPYTVTPTNYAHKHIVSIADAVYTIKGNDVRATRYIFGPSSTSERLVRVMAIAPEGRDKIAITGQVVTEDIYGAFGTAPSYDENPLNADPLIAVTLYLQSIDTAYHFYVSWSGAAATFLIELDEGSGFATLQDDYAGYTLAFSSGTSTITVRVTPYVDEVLATAEAITVNFAGIGAPTGLNVTVDNDGVDVEWDTVVGATKYQVELYVDGTPKGVREVTGTSTSYTTSQLTAMGGPWTAFAVHVRAMNDTATSEDAVFTVGVSGLLAPTGLTLQFTLASAVVLTWDAVTGATGYKVYIGSSSGFNPSSAGTLVYSGTSNSATIPVDLTAPYSYYFKVAAVDAYHQAASELNFSAALWVNRSLTSTPAAPAGLVLVLTQGMTGSWSYIAQWDDVSVATGYKLYIGTSASFAPATDGTLAYSGTSTLQIINIAALLGATPTAPVYAKVGSMDQDHQVASDMNFSSAVVFPGTESL
nr:fibronectin type III domain-containing protein [uncultured Desulfobulbus sp.]